MAIVDIIVGREMIMIADQTYVPSGRMHRKSFLLWLGASASYVPFYKSHAPRWCDLAPIVTIKYAMLSRMAFGCSIRRVTANAQNENQRRNCSKIRSRL